MPEQTCTADEEIKHEVRTVKSSIAVLFVVLAVAGLGLGAVGAMWAIGAGPFSAAATPGQQIAGKVAGFSCPDNLQSGVLTDIFNSANISAREGVDVTGLFYKVNADGTESLAHTITDTTSPSATNMDCGQVKRLRTISTDAAGGDHSRFLGLLAGDGAKIIEGGKAIEFTPFGQSYSLAAQMVRHGTLEFRDFDLDANAFKFGANAGVSFIQTDWSLTGAQFSSSVNATNVTIGAGGELNGILYVRVTAAEDRDFVDQDLYILTDGASAIWNKPVYSFDGVALDEITLSENAKKLWSGTYEYAHQCKTANGGVCVIDEFYKKLAYQYKALSGVNPAVADGPVIAFVSVGGYRQTSGLAVNYDAANDASSPAAVFTIQTAQISTA